MNQQTRFYVSGFRIKELKAVLERLSLPSSGKKSVLVNRVRAYFGEPLPPGEACNVQRVTDPWRLQAAERIVSEIYHSWKGLPLPPLQQPGAAQPAAPAERPAAQPAAQAAAQPAAQMAPNGAVEIIPAGGGGGAQPRGGGRGSSVNGRLVPSGSRADAASGRRVRCVCEPPHAHTDAGAMVQCQAEGCGVWQHAECLGRSAQQQQEQGPHFCELCRASWADPFWAAASRLLPPARLTATGGLGLRGPGGVVETQQAADKTFQLPHPVLDLVRRRDQYQLQVQCLLLGDPVPFRFQWPRNADLRVNGIAFRLYSRNPGAKVSSNARDEPADLASAAFAGRNRVRLQVSDSRKFVVLVQLMQRRSEAQVRGLMAPAETLEAALARVRQQLGAGDGDDDLAVGTSVVSLRDPLSGVRIAQPAHFRPAAGLVAFDVGAFLAMAARSRKWQCPNSMRHGRVQDVRPDGYLGEVLQRLEAHPDVTEIEVAADGRWRPAGGGYPWLDATQDLPPRAPGQDAVAVKPEPAASGSGSEEEELSEGEELRRAAAAYATSSKRQAQEVIVLDDSSDEEAPPPKRPATGAGVGQPQPAHERAHRHSVPAQGALHSRHGNGPGEAAPAGLQVRLPPRAEQLHSARQRLQQLQQHMQRVSGAGAAASQAEGSGLRLPGAGPSAFDSRQPSAGSPHAPVQQLCPTSPPYRPTSPPYYPTSPPYIPTSPPYTSAAALAPAPPRSYGSPAAPPLAYLPFSPPSQPPAGAGSAPGAGPGAPHLGGQAAGAAGELPRSSSGHAMPPQWPGGPGSHAPAGQWLAALMAGHERGSPEAAQQAAPGSSPPGAAPRQEAAGSGPWSRGQLVRVLQRQQQQRQPQQQPQAAQQGQQGAFTAFDAAVLSALLADDAVSPAPHVGEASGIRPLANGGGGGVIDLDSD